MDALGARVPMKCVAAVDVGASKIRVALFDGSRMLRRLESSFPSEGGAGAPAATIVRMARTLLGEGGCSYLEGVGVASIGPLDPRGGEVRGAPNAPIKDFPLRRPLEEAFGVPVIVANDCNAGAWAEYVWGKGSDSRSMAYIAVGTGIGGGVVIGGKLLVGPRGLAAEVGHIVVDVDSVLRCGCGARGHWEALAGGAAVPRLARIAASRWEGPRTEAYTEALEGGLTPERLYSAAREGDAFALHLVDALARIHAAGIASVAAAYDAERVFLGGGALLGGWDLLEEPIRRYLEDYSLPQLGVRVERASFGVDQQLYGAAALVYKPPETL